jgi:hypothetical protein
MFHDIAKRLCTPELADAIMAELSNANEFFLFLTEFTFVGIGGELKSGRLNAKELASTAALSEVCIDRFTMVIEEYIKNDGFRDIMNDIIVKRIDQVSEIPWFENDLAITAIRLMEYSEDV